jgi:hypothetical protein
MEDKEIELKWIPLNTKMLKTIEQIKKTVGNYSFARLSNGRDAILDRKNSKILVSSTRRYFVPSDWDLWIKRGFIVVIVNNRIKHDYDCYIFKDKDKSLIGNKVDYYAKEFLVGKSDYFKIRKSEYVKIKNRVERHFKYAIFYKDGKQISDWFDNINEEGLVNGKSDYYWAEKDWEHAIFDKNGNQVSDWYDNISLDGLIKGQSEYYIASKDWKYAIFHKNGQQISDWYGWIYTDGLVKGQADYYLAKENDKYAMFYKDGSQISDWCDDIDKDGLFEGKSNYYIAVKDRMFALFYKDGNQITDWFDRIGRYGLVQGQSDYYIVKTNNLLYICKIGSRKAVGPFKNILFFGFIEDPSQNTIKVHTPTDQYVTLTKQEVDNFLEDKEIEDER